MPVVVITKSLENSEEAYSLLQSRGLSYLHFPCIEFAIPSDAYASLDKVIRENHHYDWVFFLSRKAAESFFSRLIELGGHLFHLSPRLKIACVGKTTADFVVNEIGFPVNFIPSKFNSETLVTEFLQELAASGAASGLDPLEVILPRAEAVNDELILQLEADSRVKVTLVDAYRTCKPVSILFSEWDALIDSQDELFINFTSSQIVKNFKTILGEKRFAKFITRTNVHIISIGPQTSMTIRNELPELASSLQEASEATIPAMLDLVVI